MRLQSELLLVRRERAMWIAAALLSALCLIALFNGNRWRDSQTGAQERALQTEGEEYAARLALAADYQIHPPPALDSVLLNLFDPTSAYVVGQAGRIVHIPLPATSGLAIGLFDYLPLQEIVSIRTRQRTVADKDGLENPLQLMAGRFDLAFVTIYLLPLLILALTYNSISLEREQGTLGLVQSQPISLGWLMLGRVALRGGLLALICSAFAWAGSYSGEPVRGGLWIATVFVCGAFWLSLSLWVNSFHRDSTANAAILAVCWLCSIAIVPAILQLAAGVARPAPSRLELLAAVRDRSIDQRRDGKTLAAAFYRQHPQWMPAGNKGPVFDTATTGTMTHIEQDRRTLPLEARFEEQLAARQDLVSSLRFLSPAIVVSEALQDSAGTGLSRYRDYKAQARAFRQRWLAWFHPRIFQKTVLRPEDYRSMPVFQYREASLDWARKAIEGIAALGVISIGLAGLAVRRLR